MPRIKRWFPVSQDINSDPEVWELTDKFGDWFLRVWLQMLSAADRNEGEIRGDPDWIARSLSGLWNTHSKRYNTEWKANRVRMSFEWMSNKGWIGIESDRITILKYAEYHRTRKHVNSPPNLPNSVSSYKNKKDTVMSDTSDDPESLSVKDLVDSWNAVFSGKLSQVQWPLSKSRQLKASQRLREHSRLDYWQKVFDNIGASPFLLGSNNGTWRCNFDWLVANDSNSLKVWEGQYDAKSKGGNKRT
jgi:hypothetical protein